MTTDEMIETMARAIKAQWDTEMMKQADASSGTLDYEPGDWQEFVPEARAALSAILPVLREDIAAAVMAAPTGGRTRRVRARFDQIAKEIEG